MPASRQYAGRNDSPTSSERVAQIQALAAKLADLSILNTPTVRVRSLAIACELVRLLSDEDQYQRSLPVPELDTHQAAMQRLTEALRACRGGEGAIEEGHVAAAVS